MLHLIETAIKTANSEIEISCKQTPTQKPGFIEKVKALLTNLGNLTFPEIIAQTYLLIEKAIGPFIAGSAIMAAGGITVYGGVLIILHAFTLALPLAIIAGLAGVIPFLAGIAMAVLGLDIIVDKLRDITGLNIDILPFHLFSPTKKP